MICLAELTQALVEKQPLQHRQRNDRVVCITRFLCAQYTRIRGSRALPVKDLPLIYVGAALRAIGGEGVAESGIMAKCSLKKRERFILDTIIAQEKPRGLLKNLRDLPALYTQIVALAERYDGLTMGSDTPCTHEEALQTIDGDGFDPGLQHCLEQSYRELLALHECAGNHRRIILLQNIYRGDRRHYWLRKRAVDVLASALGLVVLSPLLLLIALLIVVDDPKGGPFFTQTRVGRHKKYFKMYKFRTMCVDAEARKAELQCLNEKDGPVFKIAKDPRITRVGAFLRKTSLDELPQLLNVLLGQMTLVGPRPPLPSEVGNYTRYDRMRLSVTPGLTCVWQVQPDRDDIPFNQWVDMDLEYIATRSQWLDMILIFKTIQAIFSKSGS